MRRRPSSKKWRKLVLYAVLQLGALAGVPMRPDEITRLMQSLSRPRAERVDPDDGDRDAPLPTPAGSGASQCP